MSNTREQLKPKKKKAGPLFKRAQIRIKYKIEETNEVPPLLYIPNALW